MHLAFSTAVAQDQEEDASDEPLTVIRAKKVITVTGDEIDRGIVVISGGKIRNVGRAMDYPRNAKVIDASDLTVMPGLINAHSRFGLPGYQRRGIHGDATVAAEFYPSGQTYQEALDAGYTTLALYPDGTGVTGRALVVRTAGKSEDRVLVSPSYVWVTAEKTEFRNGLKRAKEEIDKIEKARKEFEEKQKQAAATQPSTQPATQPAATQPATQPAFKPPDVDKAYQALIDLLQKKEGMFALIELTTASDYVHMADLLKQYPMNRHFRLNYGQQTDFYRVAEQMGEAHEQIIMVPLIAQIPFSTERLHAVKEFADAGCEISIVPVNDTPRELASVLPRVAELVRRGWPRSAALKSVTLNPAKLLGIDKRVGAIEKGKEADLIFTDVDPLDPFVKVRKVMIRGEIVHTTEGDAR